MKCCVPLLLAIFLVSCAPVANTTSVTPIPTNDSSVGKENTSLTNTAPTNTGHEFIGKILIYRLDGIYIANWDGSNPILIHAFTSPLSMMSLSPDGSNLAYFEDNYLYVQNISNENVKILNHEVIGSPGGQLKWSPDGKKIAFTCSTPSEPTISICLIDENGNIEFLINQEDIAKEARSWYFIELQDWSRDGSKIVFTYYTPSEKGQKQDFSIYYYDIFPKTTQLILDGKKQKIIAQIRGVTISPDNNTLLISGIDANSLFQIFSMNIEINNLVQLTQIPNASITNPVWSNDNCCYYVHVEQDKLYAENTAIVDSMGNIVLVLDIQGSVIQWVK
jgi:Tol biopolymer transport system component